MRDCDTGKPVRRAGAHQDSYGAWREALTGDAGLSRRAAVLHTKRESFMTKGKKSEAPGREQHEDSGARSGRARQNAAAAAADVTLLARANVRACPGAGSIATSHLLATQNAFQYTAGRFPVHLATNIGWIATAGRLGRLEVLAHAVRTAAERLAPLAAEHRRRVII